MGVSRSLLQSYGSSGLSSSLHLRQNEIVWSWCSLATVILQSSQCMCAHGAPEIAPDPCRNCLCNTPPSFCCRKWVRDRKYKNRNGPFQVCLPSVSQPVCIWLISARKVSIYANNGASSPQRRLRGLSQNFLTARPPNCSGGESPLRCLQAHIKVSFSRMLHARDAGAPNKDAILLHNLTFKTGFKVHMVSGGDFKNAPACECRCSLFQ